MTRQPTFGDRSMFRSEQTDAELTPALVTAPRRRLWDWAIDLFLILWLLSATNALIPLLVLGDAPVMTAEQRSLLRTIFILPPVAMAPFLLLSRYDKIIWLLLRNPILILLLLWVWSSAFWSFDIDVTLRRALSLTVFTLLACYLALRHNLDSILKIMAWICLALLVVNLLFILFSPSLSTMPDGRGLRGVYTHKNGLGEFLILAIALLPPAIKLRLVSPALGWTGTFVALLLLIPVYSATAIVVAFFVLATYAILGVWKLPFKVATAVTFLGMSILCFVALGITVNLDLIFEALGRDTTFTGRTELWAYAWKMIQQRWVLGYGYGAFWEVEAFSRYAADSLLWIIPNAHSGYLDLLLDLGVVGLLLFGGVLAVMINRAFVALKSSSFEIGSLVLVLLVAYNLRAIVESNLLGQNSLIWVLIVAFTVAMTPGLAAIKDSQR